MRGERLDDPCVSFQICMERRGNLTGKGFTHVYQCVTYVLYVYLHLFLAKAVTWLDVYDAILEI